MTIVMEEDSFLLQRRKTDCTLKYTKVLSIITKCQNKESTDDQTGLNHV